MMPRQRDLYDNLSNIVLLRRAWHLARDDSRTDFMFDPYRFSDFAFRLDEHLEQIARSIRSGTYHPNPLLTIDVPKSSLSVRPGSVLAIEDKIVMFAIASLIAPRLDKNLPDTVYSWRVKKGTNSKRLFEDHEILKLPFLKRSTIRKRVAFVEPWYGVWPRFIKDLEVAYEEDGYRFMVISDIVAYFENIDLSILRDILLRHLPKEPRIINFIVSLLEHWCWPSIHGAPSVRGIPQGNGVSSFMGNVYLLPLDIAFQRFCERHKAKYLRYMDDVKVLARDEHVARDALFLMNEELRKLRLNIQAAKTRLLRDEEIREEFFDERLDRVNEVIAEIQKKNTLSIAERRIFAKRLKAELKKIKGRRGVIRNKELRLFRRLITGFTLLGDSGMVSTVLNQVGKNPDSRLLNSAVRYLRYRNRNLRTICGSMARLLIEDKLLFPYQEAHCLMVLRYQRNVEAQLWGEAKKRLRRKQEHWYVRQWAAQLISMKRLSKRELDSLRTLISHEDNTEVKRALAQALAQLPQNDLIVLSQELLYEVDPKLQRLGRYFHGMLFDEKPALRQLKSLFRDFREDRLIDRLYEVEVISKADSQKVRAEVLKQLKKVVGLVRRPILSERVEAIISRIETE